MAYQTDEAFVQLFIDSGVALRTFDEIISQLEIPLVSYFPRLKQFSDKKVVEWCHHQLRFSLVEEEFRLLQETDEMIDKSCAKFVSPSQRTPEQSQLIQQRTIILAKIRRWRIRISIEIYGTDVDALSSPSTKSRGIICLLFLFI